MSIVYFKAVSADNMSAIAYVLLYAKMVVAPQSPEGENYFAVDFLYLLEKYHSKNALKSCNYQNKQQELAWHEQATHECRNIIGTIESK